MAVQSVVLTEKLGASHVIRVSCFLGVSVTSRCSKLMNLMCCHGVAGSFLSQEQFERFPFSLSALVGRGHWTGVGRVSRHKYDF
jgi:hypothetical protein